MIERKSSRARKTVDYTKFAADEDSDDDFKESTPPLSKRQKTSNNKENSKQTVKPTQTTKEPKSQKPRQSLQEKLYERELQKALELSLSQSDGSQETMAVTTETAAVTKETGDTEAPILIEETNTDSGPPSPILPTIDPPILHKVDDTGDFEVLKVIEDEGKSSATRRKAAVKKRYVDSDTDGEEPDSDFEVKGDVSSEDDSDEDFNADDSDSDFGVSSKSKKGKKVTTTSTPKPAKAGRKEKATAPGSKPAAKKSVKSTPKPSTSTAKPVISTTPVMKKSALHKSPVVSKPISSSTGSKTPSAGLQSRKMPNWTPPASSSTGKSPLGGASMTSPSTGLRIGLSRNMKLKPLHPNLKISN